MKLKTENIQLKKIRGFTTLFAVLIATLLLGVGLAIFEITVREVTFAQIVRDSDIAIYAADTGVECALYWDFKCSLSNCQGYSGASAFATSTSSAPPPSGVMCNNEDIAASGMTLAGGTVWDIQKIATAATTTFWIAFPGEPYCASVTVEKWGTPSNTQVISRGYNICTPSENRIERALQVNY